MQVYKTPYRNIVFYKYHYKRRQPFKYEMRLLPNCLRSMEYLQRPSIDFTFRLQGMQRIETLANSSLWTSYCKSQIHSSILLAKLYIFLFLSLSNLELLRNKKQNRDTHNGAKTRTFFKYFLSLLNINVLINKIIFLENWNFSFT